MLTARVIYTPVGDTFGIVEDSARKDSMEGIFVAEHFAEGRFRRAYLGTWTSPPSRRGQSCVVKEMKDSFTWKPSDWNTTKRIQEEAQEMAEGFNAFSETSHPIKFAKIEVMRVSNTGRRDPEATPRVGESVIVEEYIEGEFKKWCNNYGFISQEARTTAKPMPAFMHWSWWYNNGQMMIADLQGVKQSDRYMLTDPVILSDSGNFEYGCTDMGVEGMAMFFMKHECNSICNKLPAPKYEDVIRGIPAGTLKLCRTVKPFVQDCTAFASELRFPRSVKDAVLRTFRNVAALDYDSN